MRIFTSLVLSFFLTSQAFAVPLCYLTRAEIFKELNNEYGEGRLLTGVTHSGSALELFVSNIDQTFTILVTVPNCMGGKPCTCLMAAGDGLTIDLESIRILFHDLI